MAELLLTFFKGKISSKMDLQLVLTYDGHYVRLPKSVISRDISSGNGTNTFIFWVRPDHQGASKSYFVLGPLQFSSASVVDLFMLGSFTMWCIAVSSY